MLVNREICVCARLGPDVHWVVCRRALDALVPAAISGGPACSRESGRRIGAMNYRFSGHETFPCRYAWLPKAYQAINRDAKLLLDDENAMVELGVGKNMVHAI